MPDPQAGKASPSQGQSQSRWDPVAAFRQKYPANQEDDGTILRKLRQPGKFRAAFPEYAQTDDTKIISNINREFQTRGIDPAAPFVSTTAPGQSPADRFARSFAGGYGVTPETPWYTDIPEGLKQIATHPLRSGKLLLDADAQSRQGIIDQAYQDQRNPNHPVSGKVGSALESVEGAVPFLGPALYGAGDQFRRGDIAGGMGSTLSLGSQLAFAPEARANFADAIRTTGPSAVTRYALRKAPIPVRDAASQWVKGLTGDRGQLQSPFPQRQISGENTPAPVRQGIARTSPISPDARPERPAPIWQGVSREIENARQDRLANEAQRNMLVEHIRNMQPPPREPQAAVASPARTPLWQQAGTQPTERSSIPINTNVVKQSPLEDTRSLIDQIRQPVFQPEPGPLPDIRPGGDAPPKGLLPAPRSAYQPTVRMFHGTPVENVPSIMEHGVQPVPDPYFGSEVGGPFVTGDAGWAREMGGRGGIPNWSEHGRVSGNAPDRTATLSVDIPKNWLSSPDDFLSPPETQSFNLEGGSIPINRISGVSYSPPHRLPPSPFEGLTPSIGRTSRLLDDISSQSQSAQPGVLNTPTEPTNTVLPPLRRRTDVTDPTKLGPYIMPFDPEKF